MDKIIKFSFPTDIRFGLNASDLLVEELQARNLLKPLVVSDRFLAESSLIKNICNTLSQSGFKVSLFGGVFGNPTDEQVRLGLECFNKNRSDCIVAIGGGASMDVAKAIGLLSKNPLTLAHYDDENPNKSTIHYRIPFLAALPTTAGTGSEVGRSTVISDNKTKVKRIICHPFLLPGLVLLDPKLTQTLPANITAATGMDALTHLIEAFLVNDFHPLCDGIALEGLRLIGSSLVPSFMAAKTNDGGPKALHHRGQMLVAATMGAVAFQKGLGLNHSFAHALSTVCDIHHGLANALMLPQTMTFNHDAAPEKMARMLDVLEAKPFGTLANFVTDLNERLGIDQKLSRHGVLKSHLDDLVAVAFNDPCHKSNPKIVTQKDFRELLLRAL